MLSMAGVLRTATGFVHGGASGKLEPPRLEPNDEEDDEEEEEEELEDGFSSSSSSASSAGAAFEVTVIPGARSKTQVERAISYESYSSAGSTALTRQGTGTSTRSAGRRVASAGRVVFEDEEEEEEVDEEEEKKKKKKKNRRGDDDEIDDDEEKERDDANIAPPLLRDMTKPMFQRGDAPRPHPAPSEHPWLAKSLQKQIRDFPSNMLAGMVTALCGEPSRNVLLDLSTLSFERGDDLVRNLRDVVPVLFGVRAVLVSCTPHTQPHHFLSSDAGGSLKPSLHALRRSQSRKKATTAPDGPDPYSDVASKIKEGPIFAEMLIVHNLHLASAQVQAFLLQAIQVGSIVVDGRTFRLKNERRCVVASHRVAPKTATNPFQHLMARVSNKLLEQFVVSVFIDRDIVDLRRLMRAHLDDDGAGGGRGAAGRRKAIVPVTELRELFRQVFVSHSIRQYMRDVIACLRQHHRIATGPNAAGTRALFQAAMMHAVFSGEDYVRPLDVDNVAKGALGHRLVLRQPAAASERALIHHVITRLVTPPK